MIDACVAPCPSSRPARFRAKAESGHAASLLGAATWKVSAVATHSDGIPIFLVANPRLQTEVQVTRNAFASLQLYVGPSWVGIGPASANAARILRCQQNMHGQGFALGGNTHYSINTESRTTVVLRCALHPAGV
jgi:hypothetical protein